MNIIRFVDDAGTTGYGTVSSPDTLDTAERMRGDLLGESGLTSTGETVRVARLLAPLVPVNILCIGLNYRKHADESNMAYPERPVLFIKPTSALSNPNDPIVLPPVSDEVDYECELAIVIGKTAKNVSKADAHDCVLGYLCANDVSARDWQMRYDRQWARGKGFDTFCPLGPVLVTKDAVSDPDALAIRTVVSGETVQASNTGDMIFSTRQIISYLSQNMTLLPGTVILTGTPEGVGMGKTPPRWLKPGDVCEITVEGLGTLRNRVQAA